MQPLNPISWDTGRVITLRLFTVTIVKEAFTNYRLRRVVAQDKEKKKRG